MSYLLQAPRLQTEAPDFVRRCRYRHPRTTVFSEKMSEDIAYTTAAQDELCTLFEVHHGIVSYAPWPGPVTVRAGWNDPVEYWPSMGAVSNLGTKQVFDVVQPEDEAKRDLMGFDDALREAVDRRGLELRVVRARSIASAAKMRIAREVRGYRRWPLSSGGLEPELSRLLRANGGSVSLSFLADQEGAGPSLVATACVLVMRRRLRLSMDSKGFGASMVSVADRGARR